MGPLLIIFGTRGITYAKEKGNFHCPQCGPGTFAHKRVRRFFTLYFIPLIPLDLLGEYVECGTCRSSFKQEVLNFDPSAEDRQFEAEFHVAIRRTMALMALADGVIEPEEVTAICDIYSQIANRQISPDEVQQEIDAARNDGRGIEVYMRSLLGGLNDHGKEMVVTAAFMVAAADGEFHDDEQALMLRIGKALEMSSAHLNGVMTGLLSGNPDA